MTVGQHRSDNSNLDEPQGPRRALPVLFSLMAALVIATILINYSTSLLAARSEQRIFDENAVIDSLRRVVTTVKGAETGQRGYLLTGDEKYLAPYNKALGDIRDVLLALQKRADAGQLRPADLSQLRKLVDTKLLELDQTVQLRRGNDTEAALAIVRSDAGRQAMDQIDGLINSMIVRERSELAGLRRAARRAEWLRTGCLIAAASANLAFFGWSYGRIKREIIGRQAKAVEVRQQKDLLELTLASIGDAVIVTDAQGHVSFLNEVAQTLTGWTRAQAAGAPLSEVFRIINEQTRVPVESPVEKVLRLGTIVGLANHTLLIRHDGREIPIDDSGAPIRDPDGTVRGVVLIFRDFTDHKESQKRLQHAKAALEAAGQCKDRFLATLSHELRTPLTPVMAILDAWEAAGSLPAPLAPDIQVIRRNIELEARLIDDLLDLTRISQGKLAMKPERVDVHELIEAVTAMCRSEISTKSIGLSLRLIAARHHVNADPARLQQVLWNVLKNAIKFTGEGGHIEVASADDAGSIRIDVKDDGIGMSEETLTRLFRAFEQATQETTRRYGGLGLGLAISKAFVDAQGGSISASSDGLGKGSLLTLRLPSVTPPEPGVPAERPAPTDRPESARRPLKILLVEDHADTVLIMTRLLRGLGHTVRTSDTVAEAIELATGDRFDLLLSDIGLPDGTGIDLLRKVRERCDGRTIPAIAMTGFGMEDDVAKCREAGFAAHLTKPINFQKLEEALERFARE